MRPDSRVPPNHPLRAIRRISDRALRALSDRFDSMYSEVGCPSIPPEKLLRALLLQAFYSIRSERQLMEQMDYNLLFRWFVGLSVDEPVWVPTRPDAGRRRRGRLHGRGAEPGCGKGAAVSRTFLRRRHVDP
jgi:transposase